MKTENFLFISVVFIIIFTASCGDTVDKNNEKRAEYLEHLLEAFRSNIEGEAPVEHPIWESWLRRTGELPPDFDQLPTNAFPPDLLTFENGDPVTTPGEWTVRREEMLSILKKYNFGDWPPHPEKIAIKYQDAIIEETDVFIKQNVQLWFGLTVIFYRHWQRQYLL